MQAANSRYTYTCTTTYIFVHVIIKHPIIANYQQHVESYCLEGHSNSQSPISTIEDVLAKSPDAPLTPQEMKLTTGLARRQESHRVLEVKTGGQVSSCKLHKSYTSSLKIIYSHSLL